MGRFKVIFRVRPTTRLVVKKEVEGRWGNHGKKRPTIRLKHILQKKKKKVPGSNREASNMGGVVGKLMPLLKKNKLRFKHKNLDEKGQSTNSQARGMPFRAAIGGFVRSRLKNNREGKNTKKKHTNAGRGKAVQLRELGKVFPKAPF